MSKILSLLLGSSLLLATATIRAEEDLLAANQNFGPARPAGVGSEAARTPTPPGSKQDTPVSTVRPAPAATKPAPAPVPATAPVAAKPTPAKATPVKPAPAPVAKPVEAVPSNPEAAQMLQEETLRRQADQVKARALLDEGAKLYYAGKHETAVTKFEEALQLLPRVKATEIDHSRASHLLSDSLQQLADRALRANDRKKAVELAKRALEYEPTNRTAENIIVRVKQADRQDALDKARPPAITEGPRPDKDPAFQAKKDQVRKLFREGKIFLNSGQYDEAETRFKQILLLDPYSEDAYELLRIVNQARHPSTYAGQEANRARMIWQVDDAWLPPITGDVKAPAPPSAPSAIPGSSSGQAILQRLNEIVFPEIKFRDASLVDVVNHLSEESRKLDPKGIGVNIVLTPGVMGSGGEAVPAADGVAPTPAARGITLTLKQVPMIDALRYVTSPANLKYRIEPSAVLIVPIDAPESGMVTKTYPVTPGVFTKFVAAPSADNAPRGIGEEFRALGGGPSATVGSVDIKALFIDAGVNFPPGSSISYNERTSTIIIRNTPENIESFERVLTTLDVIPSQVEIEARFIEVSQGDLDELGFDWSVGKYNSGDIAVEGGSPSMGFPGGLPSSPNTDSITSGLRDSTAIGASAIAGALSGASGAGLVNQLATVRGILTDPQFEVVIKALSQKKTADVLSAPKVTTISGIQAQIKVVQEFIYPTEFSEPQAGENGGGTTSVPSSFKTREVGVILNVTPTVGQDKYTINLALTPEVSEFLGFLDYSPPPTVSVSTNAAAGTSVVGYRIQQPLFSTRSLATSVVIWDGQTVVLGGLMRENVQKVDDKVPFLGDLPVLGRLFRSKVTSRSKQNLLIFVTARLIDPAGNPIHRETARASDR